jgi:TolB-like protein/DNA-binding winged helix-turn-helix (wHTH) protein/Tfp pilus assembly protein PilF
MGSWDSASADSIRRFGPFETNVQTGEVWKYGIRVRLGGQPTQILTILLERAGEVVTRDQLRRRLWTDHTFVEFESGLNNAVKKLRAALGDSGDSPHYIETVPRVGYRFIAPVKKRAVHAAPCPETAGPDGTVSDSSKPVEAAPRPVPEAAEPAAANLIGRRWYLIGISCVLLAFVAWVLRVRPHAHARSEVSGQRILIAVLPFENLTGDAGQDYFSDGLTEEMIAQLSPLDPQRFGVIAHTSVMHHKHSGEESSQISRELGAQYILEGSVRRDVDRVRINAQLIQGRDQTCLWSREYDRELTGVLSLQSEIAVEIADEIELGLGDSRKIDVERRPALSPEAYEAYDQYLKGRYFWNKRTTQDLQQAVRYFDQAIARDPSAARAYSGLADSYALMAGYSGLAVSNEVMPKARAAAIRALEIDGQSAEAHTSLALVTENYDWDWPTAEREYRRAIELDPNYATAHQWYAEFLMWEGRFDEALGESERARQLDPLSLIIAADRGAILYFSRHYDQAVEQFRTVLELEPGFPRAYLIANAYTEEGRFADAFASIEHRRRTRNDETWNWSTLAYVDGRSGQSGEARRALEHLEQLSKRQQVDPAAFVAPYIALGKNDQAIAVLQKAYSQHSNQMTGLKVDPVYDPVRQDPRFQDLLRRVGLRE